jgi:hypothetical protein
MVSKNSVYDLEYSEEDPLYFGVDEQNTNPRKKDDYQYGEYPRGDDDELSC